ncbi:hypothetical protein FRC10_002891, partial [Ceratobasidium sp. 414]
MSRLIELGSENLRVNKTDEMTWLCGAYPTNDEGVVEFKTKYPGYYTGRVIRIHTMVSTNWTYLSNGTVLSNSGNVHHVGQIFFDEELSNQVRSLWFQISTADLYLRTLMGTTHSQSKLYQTRNAQKLPTDHDPASHVILGDAVTDGVLAYI